MPVLDASETMSPAVQGRCGEGGVAAVRQVEQRAVAGRHDRAVAHGDVVPPRTAKAGPATDVMLPPSTSTVAPFASVSDVSTPAVAPLSVVPVSASTPPLSAVAPLPAALAIVGRIADAAAVLRDEAVGRRARRGDLRARQQRGRAAGRHDRGRTRAGRRNGRAVGRQRRIRPDTKKPRALSPVVLTTVAASVAMRAPAPVDDRPSAPPPVVPICVPASAIVAFVPGCRSVARAADRDRCRAGCQPAARHGRVDQHAVGAAVRDHGAGARQRDRCAGARQVDARDAVVGFDRTGVGERCRRTLDERAGAVGYADRRRVVHRAERADHDAGRAGARQQHRVAVLERAEVLRDEAGDTGRR